MKPTQIALMAVVSGLVGWSQVAPPPQDSAEEAEHGVARISVMQGEVSVRHGDAGELSAAAMNAPVLATDRVATGANSRAEVQFDAFNMIRLGASSEVRLGDLQYKHYLVQIAQGITSFRVLRPNDSQVEISTPSVSMRPLGQGTFRVAVNPDGTSEITVRNGEAEVFSPRGTERLRTGQSLMARGDPSDPEYQVNAAPPFDEWDQWNLQRDGELARYTTSSRNVSPDIYGTEELDQNGRWVNDPAYGNVWVPTVAPDWAPYRVGRWVWEDYYGWTWLSGDPWGWAPYHWGRWYQGSFGWAWWPGAYGPRNYWRPALVGFFGWGGGSFGGGFGFGHVGWCPLAPFETFRPWYGRGFGGSNIVTNVNIVNNYRNARFVNGVNGVTSVRSGEFGRGAVNANNFVRASASDLRGAGSIQGRMPVTPGRESMRMSERAVNTAGMPAASANQRFAVRSGFVGPVANGGGGRTFGGTAAGAAAGVGPGSSGAPGASNGGWTKMSPRGSSVNVSSPRGSSVNVSSPRGSSVNVSSPRGSSVNVSSPRGSSVNGSSPRGSSVNGSSPRGSSVTESSPRGSSVTESSPRGAASSEPGFRGQVYNNGPGVANPGAGPGSSGGWRSFNPGAGGSGSGGAPQSAPRNNGGGFANGGNSGAPHGGATPGAAPGVEPRGGGFAGGPGYRGGAAGNARSNPADTSGYSAPPSRGFSPQQPVRISPPIVSNRGASGGGPAARPDVHSGFGGAHPSGGSGGGGNRGGGGGNHGSGGGGGGHRGR